jgi:squalene-hopene/tetraprenyl-beta-curcumene cyclase
MVRQSCLWLALPLLTVAGGMATVRAAEPATWNKAAAGKALDARATTWFEWNGADRGQGPGKITCISCHSLLPYALARPVLRRVVGDKQPAGPEARLVEQTRRRVGAWDQLNKAPNRLFYDFSEVKKRQSWGTEAVLNAVVLAGDDRIQGRKTADPVTRKAFENLWQTQLREGPFKGSWEWLNFGLEPWEADGGRYVGAALAAGAVGTAPGYYHQGADAELDGRVELLRSYLRGAFSKQKLYNRAWAVWASARLPEILSNEQRQQVVQQLRAKQQADGGWRLADLGNYKRGDGAAQDSAADGYATGFVVHVLRTAGMSKDEPPVAKGLAWLRANQEKTGGWRGTSVNRKRDPATHVGQFMSDAATAYAVLALGEP